MTDTAPGTAPVVGTPAPDAVDATAPVATTEAISSARPPTTAAPSGRSGVSVRVRITATVAALVLVALGLAGLVVYLVEAQRLNEQTMSDADRLLDEFSETTDTTSASTLQGLLGTFVHQEVAGSDQILLGWIDGPRVSSTDDPVLHDPRFESAVRSIVETGGSVRLDSEEGPLLVVAQPVRLGTRSGAFVVVSNLTEDHDYLRDTVRTYTLVSALSFLVVVLVAFLTSGRLLAPLRTLRATTEEIGETDLSRRVPERGNDDITALTRTVNGMLARLEGTFTAQREFLDDAGHELRTPLTVLRGHLELLDADNAVDVAETRALLLDEVDRMSRLVGDLILLAKSERPGFLSPGPVDVGDLTRTVHAKASGLGERRWRLDGVADVRAVLDEQRITQALLQLADNAVKHTRTGAEIGIGSAAEENGLRLWVRDDGPGVAPENAHRIFERFGRSAVAEDDEGFGLGLSIVSAIVTAHGGTVRLDGQHAPGARFVIALPAPVEES